MVNIKNSVIPKYGLKINLDHEYPENRSGNFIPSLRIIWTLLPLILRYIWYYIVYKLKKKSVVMDYLILQRAKRMYGVPIGGIGSGTIGRGYKGEFCRYQLRPDICEYNTVEANQFIVTIKNKEQETIFQSCLSTYKRSSLKSWESLIDDRKCKYTGLYPRAWTEYDLSDYGIKLICRQISPVIPHNYEDSNLPCAIFVWNVENVCDDERTVSISFTFKNGTGTRKVDRQSTSSSKAFSYQNTEGVILYHTIDKLRCSYSLAIKLNDNVKVSKCLNFDPNSCGANVWNQLKANGQFDKIVEKSHNAHIFGEMAVGVSGRTKVLPGLSQDIEMVLVWDMPVIVYPVTKKKYFRFYTEKFGTENAAVKIVDYALTRYPDWEESIYQWQKDVLDDVDLPDWYKSALFNETYFVSDGGTVWLSLEEEAAKDLKENDPRKKYGRFAYLEGHEYRMYNSYDVHFYASHALSKNWPHLQRSLQYDLRDFVSVELPQKFEQIYNGEVVERKKPNTVPHDAGDPGEGPFDLINAYPIHDVSNWRDLSPKFVLQTLRDATSSGSMDTNFVEDMFDTCEIVMNKALIYDKDGDGLIENSGEPDQTYDIWVMKGCSSYCGGIWLAALYAMTLMADVLQKIVEKDRYQKLLDSARQAFDEKLWNGSYYNFDCSLDQGKSIMADQLNGHWYLGCSGFGHVYPILPKSKIRSALRSIYENNVLCFCEGNMGAVNGFLTGQVDKVAIQSQEVWTGVTYALAATMIQEGMVEEGFKTAGGMFKSMSEKFGMIFDTPEALYGSKYYRSIGYMRPLSIWSMQIAWEKRKSATEPI
ncbi:non-lysosomal glucosylceramidase [Rhynchophorus ferrugineus]|uniref:non-lysosomal glucosylceramidase n=1 Tax=Rhynchophorus ferrugineus TaxID=354439 RepID=UPI003FCD775A